MTTRTTPEKQTRASRTKRTRKRYRPVWVLFALILLVLAVIAALVLPDKLRERARARELANDTVPPVIELVSDEGVYTIPGQEYAEEGYTATDNLEGDLTERVERTETNGVVTYTVADSAGNRTTVTRTIVYHDPVPPVLSLNGDSEITLTEGTPFAEPGYTARDNVDGDLTERVTVSGTVDSAKPGTYELTYAVEDTYRNRVTAKRTVTVLAAPAPKPDTETGEKIIYLTFDDGPGLYTAKLLDILAKYNVKATFFVTNTNPGYTDLITREANEGHSVGVHSATHVYKQIYASEDAFWADFAIVDDLIYEKTGTRTKLMRFPGGSSNNVSAQYNEGIMTRLTAAAREKGYQYFDWNVGSGDAGQTTDTATIVQNVINGVRGKKTSVVLQHDIHDFSVDAVEDIILWGLENGYTFLPLDETSYAAHHRLFN